jgi:hypothetical protein
MADAVDSKSTAARRAGSTPASGTVRSHQGFALVGPFSLALRKCVNLFHFVRLIGFIGWGHCDLSTRIFAIFMAALGTVGIGATHGDDESLIKP